MSSIEYGPLLEHDIKNIFDIKPRINTNSGDGVINNKNIEIKVTLGDKKGGFNFVQIRPNHDIHYYLFYVIMYMKMN